MLFIGVNTRSPLSMTFAFLAGVVTVLFWSLDPFLAWPAVTVTSLFWRFTLGCCLTLTELVALPFSVVAILLFGRSMVFFCRSRSIRTLPSNSALKTKLLERVVFLGGLGSM